MATTTAYSVLSGSDLIQSVTNDVGDDLLKLADLVPNYFAPGAVGTRRVALFLTGFLNPGAGEDITVNVRVKLPEPIKIDAGNVAHPAFNLATPFWTLAPANERIEYYDVLKPRVYGTFPDPQPAAGVTLTEQIVTVEVAGFSGTPVGMMLGIDFFYSASR